MTNNETIAVQIIAFFFFVAGLSIGYLLGTAV